MKEKAKSRMWLTPVLLALIVGLGIGAVVFRYGGTIQNLIHVAIKLAVTK
jgi:uncharacterized membrane-anchored protein YhcB (DUF1043 family)